jgi:hypothetical protein
MEKRRVRRRTVNKSTRFSRGARDSRCSGVERPSCSPTLAGLGCAPTLSSVLAEPAVEVGCMSPWRSAALVTAALGCSGRRGARLQWSPRRSAAVVAAAWLQWSPRRSAAVVAARLSAGDSLWTACARSCSRLESRARCPQRCPVALASNSLVVNTTRGRTRGRPTSTGERRKRCVLTWAASTCPPTSATAVWSHVGRDEVHDVRGGRRDEETGAATMGSASRPRRDRARRTRRRGVEAPNARRRSAWATPGLELGRSCGQAADLQQEHSPARGDPIVV